MKRLTIASGICAVLLIAAIFAAGCTSAPSTPATGTGTAPQVTQVSSAPAGSSISPVLTQATVPNPGVLVESTADIGSDSSIADAPVDPYNSTSQATTMVPDSAELGDPIP